MKIPRWTWRALVVLLGITAVLAGAVAWLVLTPAGSRLAARSAVWWFARPQALQVGKVEGNLLRGMSIHELELVRPRRVPIESVLQVQRLDVVLRPVLHVRVFNGRLRLPDAAPLLVYGNYDAGQLSLHVFWGATNIHRAITTFLGHPLPEAVSGTIQRLDGQLRGTVTSPHLTAGFYLQQLQRGDVALAGCPGSLDLTLKGTEPIDVHGRIGCQRGTFTMKRTTIELEPSALVFAGDPKQPRLAIHGHAEIEGVKIHLALTGTRAKPDIALTSTPPLPQEQLLAMLATGQRWEGVGTALGDKTVTLDLAKDLLDYALFGGVGSKLRRSYGTDVNVTLNEQAQGIGLTQRVGKAAEIGYDIEQSRQVVDGVTQSVRGEYNVAPDTSVEVQAERKLGAGAVTNSPNTGTPDQNLWVKLKKNF